MSSRGGASPVSDWKQSAPSCHWSLMAVGDQPSPHSGGSGIPVASGESPSGMVASGTAHCQPSSQSRPIGVVHTFCTDSAPCTLPASCRIGERRADLAHDAQHRGHVLGAGAHEARAHRFAGDPAAQIARPANAVGGLRPIVVRRRHSRMIAMRQRARLRLEPRTVRRVRAPSRATASGPARRSLPGYGDAAARALPFPSSSRAEAPTPRDARAAREKPAERRPLRGAAGRCWGVALEVLTFESQRQASGRVGLRHQ